MALPAPVYRTLFAGTTSRIYIDPTHMYRLTIDSCTSTGEPFHLPKSLVNSPPRQGPENQQKGEE